MRYKPWPYQTYAKDFLLEHEEAGLFLDMGLGKTVTTLTALMELSWDWERVLIIAPKRPAVDTWPDELEKWDHLKAWAPSCRVAVGTAQERRAAVDAAADITIINRENVQWLVEYLGRAWPYDCVVIDELSSFKSSRAKRFRALKKVRPKIRRIIGLTGTPLGNGYMDLWAEVYLLDGGKALGRTITGYRDRWFTPGRRNGQIVYEWNLRKGADEEILERISPFCVTMKTEDYIDLPALTTIERGFTLSRKGKAAYDQMERTRLLELADAEIDAVNAAALLTKLLQISTGQIYDEDGGIQDIHREKLGAFEELAEELEGENLLVFYQYRHEKARLLEAFPYAVDIAEDDAIGRWKKGEIKMLLAHPQSAGHGLNLQSGGSVSVWYSLPMSLELYQQAVKRLHRQGQTKPVRNIVLLAKGTAEETVWREILTKKVKRQEFVIEALKARIKEVKK